MTRYHRMLKILSGYILLVVLSGLFLPSSFSRLERLGLTYTLVFACILIFVKRQYACYSIRFFNQPTNTHIALVVLLVVGAVCYYSMYSIVLSSFSIFMTVIYVAFIQTLSEEIIFRGLVFNELLKLNHTFKNSLILSSAIFGLFHLISLFKTDDYFSVLNQVIVAGMMGYFLAVIYVVIQNILIVGVLHMLINLPAYVKRIANTNSSSSDLVVNDSFIESIISSFFVIGLYTPFVIIAFLLLRWTHRYKKPLTEGITYKYPFLDFNKLKP